MKTLIASAILLSGSAVAHDVHFSSNSCDVDLNAGISIKQNVITFTKNNKPLYQIIDNQTLIVDGKTISLDSNQEKLVNEYSTKLRVVPTEAKRIAIDAIDLAAEGVNLAFSEILGEGNDISVNLTRQLTEIRSDVNSQFDVNDFTIDENGNLQDDFFTEEFGQKISDMVQDTVKNSMGTLLVAVGQQMLFSGDMDAFEAKMENFGSQIEAQMEQRGELIEAQGERLCHSVYEIDQLEEKLKSNIEEMPQVNVIVVDKSSHKKA